MHEQLELIDEQDAARLLERAAEIIARANDRADPAASIHISGYHISEQLNRYLRDAYAEAAASRREDTPAGQSLLQFIDWTDQLAAHHLDFLDRLDPV
jgi:hypothetical protein